MTYSIIQWGSGTVGSQVIAEVARRRELKLKGLFVYNPEKVGVDAGQIAKEKWGENGDRIISKE